MKWNFPPFSHVIIGNEKLLQENFVAGNDHHAYDEKIHSNSLDICFSSISLKSKYHRIHDQIRSLEQEIERNEEIRLRKKQKKKEKKLRKRERIKNRIKAEQENEQQSQCGGGEEVSEKNKDDVYTFTGATQSVLKSSGEEQARSVDFNNVPFHPGRNGTFHMGASSIPSSTVFTFSTNQLKYLNENNETLKNTFATPLDPGDNHFSFFTLRTEIHSDYGYNCREYSLFGPNEQNRHMVFCPKAIESH